MIKLNIIRSFLVWLRMITSLILNFTALLTHRPDFLFHRCSRYYAPVDPHPLLRDAATTIRSKLFLLPLSSRASTIQNCSYQIKKVSKALARAFPKSIFDKGLNGRATHIYSVGYSWTLKANFYEVLIWFYVFSKSRKIISSSRLNTSFRLHCLHWNLKNNYHWRIILSLCFIGLW